MSWKTTVSEMGGGHDTTHSSESGHLRVVHEPSGPQARRAVDTHFVRVFNRNGPHAMLSWPSAGDSGKAYIHDGQSHYVDPPSERLRALIEAHGTDHAWMPLLDALAEEYPEHFNGPVQRHTEQRFS